MALGTFDVGERVVGGDARGGSRRVCGTLVLTDGDAITGWGSRVCAGVPVPGTCGQVCGAAVRAASEIVDEATRRPAVGRVKTGRPGRRRTGVCGRAPPPRPDWSRQDVRTNDDSIVIELLGAMCQSC